MIARMPPLKFVKMQGLGNDFVVLDATRAPLALDAAQVRRIADRRFGVGCDQVLVVERPWRPEADFGYRIFNSDGSEVEQCGNGARCFARFVREQGLTDKRRLVVDTSAGPLVLQVLEDERVRVDMGVPRFAPAEIPFEAPQAAPEYDVVLDDGLHVRFSALSMGNPHAVITVDDVDDAPVSGIGPRLERHARFPRRVNVGFMQIVDRGHIRLRVWERGAGETLACGSGACAAVVAGIRRGVLDHDVRVQLRGGELRVQWPGADTAVMMTGPAETVFEGQLPDQTLAR